MYIALFPMGVNILSLLGSAVVLPVLVWPLFQEPGKNTVYISAKTHFVSFLVTKKVDPANFNSKNTSSMPWILNEGSKPAAPQNS